MGTALQKDLTISPDSLVMTMNFALVKSKNIYYRKLKKRASLNPSQLRYRKTRTGGQNTWLRGLESNAKLQDKITDA
jgi:hypothetical protein